MPDRLENKELYRTEEKAKVVAAVLGIEFIKFLATLAILHHAVRFEEKD